MKQRFQLGPFLNTLIHNCPVHKGLQSVLYDATLSKTLMRSKFSILLTFTLVLHHQATITAHPVFDPHESNHLHWDLTGNIRGFTFRTDLTHSHKQAITF